MSKHWKPLNIDNRCNHQAISDEVYNYVVHHTTLYSTRILGETYLFTQDVDYMLSHCPLLAKFLNKQRLTPTSMAVIISSNKDKLNMHIDNDGSKPRIRILWPIKNCQGSKTQFWNVPRGSGTIIRDFEGGCYVGYPADQQRELVEEVEVIAPIAVDTSVPHSVIPNPDNQDDRITLSIGFDNKLPISQSIEAWATWYIEHTKQIIFKRRSVMSSDKSGKPKGV